MKKTLLIFLILTISLSSFGCSDVDEFEKDLDNFIEDIDRTYNDLDALY